ncbi:MAG TPA: branched-chain amino acid ABC transporter permease [Desulfatiglandales bacterium]|jgi:branched-chain amino acid transport system permease protein
MLLQHLANGLLISGIYALVAVGFTLIFGVLGVINFAHGEFYMLGAFIIFFFAGQMGVSYYWSIPLSILASLMVGILVERTSIRPLLEKSFESMVICTFAVSMILMNGTLLIWGAEPRIIQSPLSAPVSLLEIAFTYQRLLVLVVAIAISIALHLFLQRTKPGKAIRAAAQNKEACQAVGIDIAQISRLTFGLGIGLCGLAGALVAPVYSVFPTMGQIAMFKIFAIVILGGLGNVKGALLAALILGLGESLIAGYVSATLKDGLAFLVMLFILLLRPEGIFGKAVRTL